MLCHAMLAPPLNKYKGSFSRNKTICAIVAFSCANTNSRPHAVPFFASCRLAWAWKGTATTSDLLILMVHRAANLHIVTFLNCPRISALQPNKNKRVKNMLHRASEVSLTQLVSEPNPDLAVRGITVAGQRLLCHLQHLGLGNVVHY